MGGCGHVGETTSQINRQSQKVKDFDEATQRMIKENYNTLKFDLSEFENKKIIWR